MPYLILTICGIIAAFLLMKWFAASEPKDVLKGAKLMALIAVVGLAVFLLVTGRLGLAIAAIASLVPWAMRMFAIYMNVKGAARMAKNFSRASRARAAGFGNPGDGTGTGQTSEVNTRFLRMTLDHDTGHMEGAILEGPWQGQRLSDLTETALLDFLSLCHREDMDSAQILESYLDRTYPDWRQQAQGQQSSDNSAATSGAMSRDEALRILGLEEGASKADIKKAYHRLMAAMHPDHGGSDYLAAQINRAKDLLLNG